MRIVGALKAWALAKRDVQSGPTSDLMRSAVVVVLIVAIGGCLAQAAVEWRRGEQLQARLRAPAIVSVRQGVADDGPDKVLGLIVAGHLFGASVSPKSDADMGPSLSQWVLTGTIAGATPDSGSAILGESAAKVRLHTAGENIAPGYRLAQVFPERVTVEHNGERFSLELPHGSGTLVSLGPGPVVADRAGPMRRSLPQGQAPEWDPGEPPALIILQPRPHIAPDGKYAGMEISGRNASRLGLQVDDVVTQVNGHPVDSQDAGLTALQNLSTNGQATATVVRNGVTLQMALRMPDGD
jgi:general secretion pathway protein C